LGTFNPVSQAIITSRTKFPKDVDHYAPLAFFGSNVVVSEGEEWKKFRKIVAPAFSEVRPELHLSPYSRLILNTIARETTNWYGTKPPLS
jgi:cytochrome P450